MNKYVAKLVLLGGGDSGLPQENEKVIVMGENDYYLKAKMGNNNQYYGLLMNRDHIGEDKYDQIINAVDNMLDDKTGAVRDGYHSFDELYDYRKAYNACLFNQWAKDPANPMDIHKSYKHSDGEDCFGGGWFVVQATTPFGQISNHYKNSDWDLFNVPVKERANEWDGHTPMIALDRLMKCAAGNV